MKKVMIIYFNKSFLTARVIINTILIGYYFVLVFIWDCSCPSTHVCALCGLKTAMWETLKLHLIVAYQYNSLVILLWIICILIIADIIYLIHQHY